MQTYTHVLINAGFGKTLERRGIRPMYWALSLGSLMPDVPLVFLTINYILKNGGFNQPPQELFGPEYDALYFTDPVWVAGHNLMHAPLMTLLYMVLGWFFGWQRGRTWGRFLFWFGLGNTLHSLVDIPTHANDGPLLLFPFNWTLRFQSPVSYWDPSYYGAPFALFELVIGLMLVAYFIGEGVRALRRRGAPASTEAEAV